MNPFAFKFSAVLLLLSVILALFPIEKKFAFRIMSFVSWLSLPFFTSDLWYLIQHRENNSEAIAIVLLDSPGMIIMFVMSFAQLMHIRKTNMENARGLKLSAALLLLVIATEILIAFFFTRYGATSHSC